MRAWESLFLLLPLFLLSKEMSNGCPQESRCLRCFGLDIGANSYAAAQLLGCL